MIKRIDKKWFLSYFAVFVLICFSYLYLYKYGKNLIWNIDSVGQYYPAFLYIGEYIRNFLSGLLSGKIIAPFFDLSIGMGEDIVGCLNYYGFGDPINLISIFSNKDNGVFIFTFVYFLKLFFAGLAFQKYCHYLKLNKGISVFGSICYCFCGFAIYGSTMYIEWSSVLIYFPLVLLGVEKLIKEDRKSVFIISIFYGALCGFYFLFMVSLCLPIYVLVRGKSCCDKDNKKLLEIIIKAVACYFVGLFLAAPVFLPSVKAFFESERSSQSIFEVIGDINNWIPRKDRLLFSCILNPFHGRMSFSSNITVTETICLAVLFILIWNKKANQLKLAFSICFVSYLFPIVNLLFNGFGEETNRWLFILSFIVALIFVYVITYIVNGEFNLIDLKEKYLNIIICCICVATVLNLSYGILSLFRNWKNDFIDAGKTKYYVESPFNEFSLNDNDLFRVSNTSLTNINGRPENVAMINDYNGNTYWFSIINKNTMDFANKYNDENVSWRSYGFGDNSILNGNIGCKYLITDEKVLDNGYELIDTADYYGNTWNLYKNSNFVEFAFISNNDIDECDKVSFNDSITGKVSNLEYIKENNVLTCSAICDENSSLNILFPYSNNWKAYVNGKEVDVKRSNGMFISIDLDPNIENNITLEYKNDSIIIGTVISLITLAIVLIYYILDKRNKHLI